MKQKDVKIGYPIYSDYSEDLVFPININDYFTVGVIVSIAGINSGHRLYYEKQEPGYEQLNLEEFDKASPRVLTKLMRREENNWIELIACLKIGNILNMNAKYLIYSLFGVN